MLDKTTIVILAGGKGKRLLPITKSLPKPLIKINNKEILSYVLDSFNDLKYIKMIILTGYKSNLIKKFISKKYKNKKIKKIFSFIFWKYSDLLWRYGCGY